MKIGIDLDEVIVDFIGGFLDYYNEKYNKNIKREAIKSYNLWENEFFKWAREDAVEFVDEFNKTKIFDNLNVFENVKEVIDELKKDNELFLIISRREELRERTGKFLKEKFGDVFSKIVFTSEFNPEKRRDKSEVCKEFDLDFMIEDNKDYAKECAEKKIKVFLVDQPWNQGFEFDNVIRVGNLKEVLDLINESSTKKTKKQKSGLSKRSEKYFESLSKEIQKNYDVARKARSKGLDPVDEVEVPLALTMAAKVIRLIATKYPQLDNEEIINRLIELEEEYGALEPQVSFKIAEEVAKEKYCKFETQLEAMDAGIRVGFAYTTLGVVASPIEGYTELRTGKTQIGETYLKAFFSGPIRSAGTTASCVVIMIIDYIRQLFGYAKYDPTEIECKRVVTELYDYHDRVTNLQYLPTEEEAYFIAKNCPIQITGDPTESREVSNYKNLPRVEGDFIRGGFCLIVGEGLAQKAKKGLRLLKKVQDSGIKVSDWEWLDEYVELHEKETSVESAGDATPTYIKDLVAGRPVFGHPGASGGFRVRYGRSRVAGFSAVSVHPATMGITNDFIATGTQLKIEKPTKGCVTTPCDGIDGPIVKFKNGSVRKIESYEEAKELYKEVEEIIYLGDMLFPLGDVINRNAMLIKTGYVEEWWGLELEKLRGVPLTHPEEDGQLKGNSEIDKEVKSNKENKKSGEDEFDSFNISIEKAIELSKEYGIALHPKYIYYWTQLSYGEFLGFIDWFQHSRVNEGKLLFPYNKSESERFKVGKRALELLGIEHSVGVENVILEKEDYQALFLNLGFDIEYKGESKGEVNIDFKFKKYEEVFEKVCDRKKEGKKVLEIVNELSDFKIKDKAGEFIGTRMGRPEKAKMRKLTGSPHILFPVGDEGGRLRSVNEAVREGVVRGEFPFNYCKKCSRESIYKTCEVCGEKTEKKYFCRVCNKDIEGEKCKAHDIGQRYKRDKIDIKHYFDKAREKLGMLKVEIPELIKGVRGTSSEGHDMENMVKGILRSKHDVCVNKDGTIRYDMTELPLSHFKPKEIEVSVSRLRELGYEMDCFGNDLVRDDQILELQPHDVLLSCNELSGEGKGDDLFVNIANYMDDLLEKFYGLPRFFNVKTRDDLVGQLVVCMAPHNCAGVIGRIIGFCKVQGLMGSPYLHAAMRRDCDGDEAAMMMLLDVLINFSRKFLPSHRGGTQDAPLVLNGKILAREVDDQILDFELVNNYPLELYERAERGEHSSCIEIEMVKQRIGRGEDPYINTGFTHSSSDFNGGAVCSSYKTLPSMREKVESQMLLCEKLRSVDQGDVARLIIDRHFMRDLKGNLRKFSQQKFRCSSCNESYRRPPLSGKCVKCPGKIIFTISYGSIVKYLEPGLDLTRNYNVPAYITQDLELTKRYIESIFGRELEKQESIEKWF